MDAAGWMHSAGRALVDVAGQEHQDSHMGMTGYPCRRGHRRIGQPCPHHLAWPVLAGLSRAVAAAASLAAPGTHCCPGPRALCSLQARVPAHGVGTLIPGEEGLAEALSAPKVPQAAPYLNLRCCRAGGCGQPQAPATVLPLLGPYCGCSRGEQGPPAIRQGMCE